MGCAVSDGEGLCQHIDLKLEALCTKQDRNESLPHYCQAQFYPHLLVSYLYSPARSVCGDGAHIQGCHARQLQPQHPFHDVHITIYQLSDAVLHLGGKGGGGEYNSKPEG